MYIFSIAIASSQYHQWSNLAVKWVISIVWPGQFNFPVTVILNCEKVNITLCEVVVTTMLGSSLFDMVQVDFTSRLML